MHGVRATYFDPYHAALREELVWLRAQHGRVVLYDCHSIRSLVPRLFDGQLPVFNIGTNAGQSCAPALTSAVEAACDASGLGRVTNGRFKGGFITRHYGAPAAGVHAIQMELACRAYMREEPGPVSQGRLAEPLGRRLRGTRAGGAAPRAGPGARFRHRPSPSPCPCRGAPMTRIDNARRIASPRGPTLTAKSWLTEAPMRMLMNNLDETVAERPGELVVYGGIGRAARDWGVL